MKRKIGLAEALELTLAHIAPLEAELLPLERIVGRVLAEDVASKVDSPSIDASLKDGYAVCSGDLAQATETAPVALELVGSATAGNLTSLRIESGKAVRVTTGSSLPLGANAVLAEEFAEERGETLVCRNTAEPGRNILERGTDIRAGQVAAKARDLATPPLVGLLATAGIDRVRVFKSPDVAVVATGDEVVAPGKPIPEGHLYASNVTEICAWLTSFGISNRVSFAGDDVGDVASAIERQMDHADAFISSGGIWGSESDLMLEVLEARGWKGIFHRVRIGPGKAIAFGLLEGKPFFCLPGGPPSNEMAFLQIALPGVLWMRGHSGPAFPTIAVRLGATVRGVGHWTQFIQAKLDMTDGLPTVYPLQQKSRLQTMAHKDALICIPEGTEVLLEGAVVEVQVLDDQVLRA